MFLVVLIFGSEIYLRIRYPYDAFNAANELSELRRFSKKWNLHKIYTVDPKFGFRPILGTDMYSKFGTRSNSYSFKKSHQKRRLLFIGDSVTQAGHIINGLRKLYGEEKFEYWNAGVGSFNTVQEVNYYKGYNHNIHPDHVILTFHLNDFETTPVALYDINNNLNVYAPKMPLRRLNPWLFKYSYLYRFLTGLKMIQWKDRNTYENEIYEEVKKSLNELKEILKSDSIDLTVIIHPPYQYSKKWSNYKKYGHDKAVQLMRELDIRYYELYKAIDKSFENGISLKIFQKDPWHPNKKGGDLFAEYLHNNGFLDSKTKNR
jgi:GDSL-like Lipase/Acylhydrolase